MFAAIREFNLTVWLIIISTLLTRFTFFMVWPFLAIILFEKFSLNEAEIGAFITIPIIIGVSVGFFVGYLSDKIRRRKIIIFGLIINIIAMLILGLADNMAIMFMAMIIQSISRSMIENPGKALMTDMLESRSAKDLALHLRYFTLNIGAAFGPFVGVFIGTTGQQLTFNLVAVTYAIYLLAGLIIFSAQAPKNKSKMAETISMKSLLDILLKDYAFLIFVFASLLAFIAYAQIEVGLLQYLRVENFPQITKFYASLIFINGMTIIIFQFPLLKLLQKWQPLNRASLGVLLFIIAFFGFAFTPKDFPQIIMISVFVLSIGEVILFPTMSIIVDTMAPSHLKGSYFGAAALGGYGFALAPIIGGFLLHQFGGMALWLIMALLSLLVGQLFFLAEKMRKNSR